MLVLFLFFRNIKYFAKISNRFINKKKKKDEKGKKT